MMAVHLGRQTVPRDVGVGKVKGLRVWASVSGELLP